MCASISDGFQAPNVRRYDWTPKNIPTIQTPHNKKYRDDKLPPVWLISPSLPQTSEEVSPVVFGLLFLLTQEVLGYGLVSPVSTSFRSFRRGMMRARGVVSLGVQTGKFGGTNIKDVETWKIRIQVCPKTWDFPLTIL